MTTTMRPYLVAAILFAVACLLLPAPTPAQEPPDDGDAQIVVVVEQLAPTPEPVEPPPAEVEPASDEDAGDDQADGPVSEEVSSEPDQSGESERGPPPVEIEPPTLAGMHGELLAAITAGAGNQVRVDAAGEALAGARQALADAEASHGVAVSDQGERDAGVRAAAQAFVDFLVSTYLQPAAGG